MGRTEKKFLSNGNESRNFGLLSCSINHVCTLAAMEMQVHVTPFMPTRVSERKKTTASCGRDEEIGAPLRGWCSHCVEQFIEHQRAKHRVTLGPNNCPRRYIPP